MRGKSREEQSRAEQTDRQTDTTIEGEGVGSGDLEEGRKGRRETKGDRRHYLQVALS